MGERRKIEFWQDLVDHINQRYKEKKGFDYPFRGKDMKDLAVSARIFRAWGVMALYDIWIDCSDEWAKSKGYPIWAFCSSIPWLTDKPWKERARTYELKLLGPVPSPILELFDRTMEKVS